MNDDGSIIFAVSCAGIVGAFLMFGLWDVRMDTSIETGIYVHASTLYTIEKVEVVDCEE